ncbi:hypothetical protein EV202_105124 [Bacteroides heparinolyticus]|uniref:Uncharacterized protein n=1 Tax=Prevotella heparinolytica TaxID=28113 RepID=A0A4V2SEZ1_9BACE|nr:hypothetical protein EV202_105124 [Bacteroides heparinolyticus]
MNQAWATCIINMVLAKPAPKRRNIGVLTYPHETLETIWIPPDQP